MTKELNIIAHVQSDTLFELSTAIEMNVDDRLTVTVKKRLELSLTGYTKACETFEFTVTEKIKKKTKGKYIHVIAKNDTAAVKLYSRVPKRLA